jgi:Pilus biogenesis CpaD protein (pilus_cpaD)
MMIKRALISVLGVAAITVMLSGCYYDDPKTALPDHSISLIANPEKGGKLVAVPKPCPNWESHTLDGLENQFTPDFGCANMYNLGKMISNPSDLIHGEALGEADAASGVLGIERYRQDKKKELINPKDISATGK